MADLTKAEEFHRAFKMLAKSVTPDTIAVAKALLKESEGYDFERSQMHVDDILVRFGLIKYPAYPQDYPGYVEHYDFEALESWIHSHEDWVKRWNKTVGAKLGRYGYTFLTFAFQTSNRDVDQEIKNLEAAGDRDSVGAAALLRTLKSSALRRSFARREGLNDVHVAARSGGLRGALRRFTRT